MCVSMYIASPTVSPGLHHTYSNIRTGGTLNYNFMLFTWTGVASIRRCVRIFIFARAVFFWPWCCCCCVCRSYGSSCSGSRISSIFVRKAPRLHTHTECSEVRAACTSWRWLACKLNETHRTKSPFYGWIARTKASSHSSPESHYANVFGCASV